MIAIERDFRSVIDRGLLAIGRGVLKLVSEHPGVQLVQVEALKGEVIDQAEHMQAYGFASHPLSGAEAVINAVGGSRNHPLIVVIADRRHRPALAPGEAIVHDDQGQFVHLRRDGITVHTDKNVRIEGSRIEVVATDAVHVEAPSVEVESAALTKIQSETVQIQASTLISMSAPHITAPNINK